MVALVKGRTALCSSGVYLLQGGGLGRLILLGAHVQSGDTAREESGGRDRAGSFSARPRRLWNGLYSQREREGDA